MNRHRSTRVLSLLMALLVAACAAPMASRRSEPPTAAHASAHATPLAATPSPVASVALTPDPTPAPSPLAEPVSFSLALDGEGGRQRVIRFRDFTGTLEAVRDATADERMHMGVIDERIWLETMPGDPASVYVRWDGGICDLEYAVDLNPTAPEIVVREADRHACDAAGWSTSIVLTFDTPRDAERLVPELIEGRVFPRT